MELTEKKGNFGVAHRVLVLALHDLKERRQVIRPQALLIFIG
jgi:hypothetical protein